jgi:transposase
MSNFYLGSDVSKGYADFVILDELKAVREKHFTLDDTARGHQHLFQVLHSFCEQHSNATIYAAVESTGGYENNWHQTLRSIGVVLPVKTARLNPSGIRHHGQAALKRTSTDKISATTIAEYQINYPEVIQYDQQDEFKSMKRLYTAFRMFVKIRTQLLNQMETVLYTANPELVQYRKDNTPKWLLRLLAEYPVADDLARASIDDLASIPYVSVQRAEEIIAAAQNSVASATDAPTQVVMKTIVNQILALDRSIQTLKKQATSFVDVPEIELITSIHSIGVMSAIGLYIELGGCIAKFPRAKELCSFWGVHPLIKDSGDGGWIPRMSKQGRKMPRSILFMAVLNGIRTDSYIQHIYHRQLAKGKCKMSAIGICMHKLARIIFGVLSNKTPFDPEIDKQNQRRSKTKKENKTEKTESRRFQQEDQQAPISRRQTRKRKERKESQSEHVTVREISVPAPSGV